MRKDLPKDTDRPLSFAELVATLTQEVGEVVCARVDGVIALQGQSQFQASGPLRPLALSWAPAFAVGELFVLVLDEVDFESAQLWTFDGNAFFEIQMRFGDKRITVGSPEHMGADYEGL